MSDKILQRFFQILGSQISLLLLQLAATPLLVRGLGSDGYGDYAFLLSVLGLVMVVINGSIFDGLRKFINEDRDMDRWSTYVMGYYARIVVIAGVFISAIILTLVEYGIIAKTFGREVADYVLILIPVIGGRQVFTYIRGCLMGLEAEHLSEPLLIVQKLFFVVIAVTLAFWGFGVPGVLAGHIVSLLIVGIVGLFFVKPFVHDMSSIIKIPNGFPQRELATFNIKNISLILIVSSFYHSDILLMRYFTSSTQTGYYKGSLIIAQFLWFVPIAVQTLLLQSSSALWDDNNMERIDLITGNVVNYTLMFSLILAIGISFLSDVFIPLYFGPEFNPAIKPLLILLPGSLGFAIARPLIAIGRDKGELDVLVTATAVAAVINIILNIILIPEYEMIGAAIATTVGYGLMAVTHIVGARRIGLRPLSEIQLARTLVVCVLTSIPLWVISQVLPDVFELLLIPIAGLAIFAGLCMYLNIIPNEDVKKARRKLQQLF